MNLYLLDDIAVDSPLVAGAKVLLCAEESRHLLKVMRSHPGDPVLLTDGHGRYYDGRLESAERRSALVEISAVREDPEAAGPPRLHLACGVIKGRRFEWALEKAVEIGAHDVWPLRTEHAVVDPRPGKSTRWNTTLRSALKQSGRSRMPELHAPATLAEFLSALPAATLYYGVSVPDHQARADTAGSLIGPQQILAAARDGDSTPNDIGWVVGPEGGWSDSELEVLARAATPVRLGPHRLRTETAAAAGMVILQTARDLIRAAG